MKRRDFIKTSACIGCAGALGACAYNCKNFDIEDIKNNIVARKFLYKDESELPKSIRIDICNLCQLNCVKCWARNNEEKIKKYAGGFGYVPFETFKEFIDKHLFLEHIEMSGHGEALLNPDLAKIIKYAYEKNIKLSAWGGVNLNTLSEELAEAMVKYKFEGMVASIDGATPETYAIYRRGGDFNTVINNIKMINKFKEKYNSEYPKIIYKMIVFGHNEHEIEAVKKLAAKLNVESTFGKNFCPEYSPIKNLKKVKELTGINDIDEENWEQGCCELIAINPKYNWNGELFGCNGPTFQGFRTNLFKEGLLNSLNNQRFLYAKLMLSDFSVKPRQDIPCTNCEFYEFLKHNNINIDFDKIKKRYT